MRRPGRDAGVEAKVVVGGIIPKADEEVLLREGVIRVYSPKDYSLSHIMSDMLELVEG